MKKSKLFLVTFLCLCGCLLRAQTNTPTGKQALEQDAVITADSGYFDGMTNQMVYIGHVFATYGIKAKLKCELLTVFMPEDRSNPTNIVAETNVVVDVVDEHGQTNHITADRAVYSYMLSDPVTNLQHSVTNIVYATTNEIVTFTAFPGNPMPRADSANGYVKADPLVFNVIKKIFSFPGHVEMGSYKLPGSGQGTNNPLFNPSH